MLFWRVSGTIVGTVLPPDERTVALRSAVAAAINATDPPPIELSNRQKNECFRKFENLREADATSLNAAASIVTEVLPTQSLRSKFGVEQGVEPRPLNGAVLARHSSGAFPLRRSRPRTADSELASVNSNELGLLAIELADRLTQANSSRGRWSI
jgi:hypothetical protein